MTPPKRKNLEYQYDKKLDRTIITFRYDGFGAERLGGGKKSENCPTCQ